jgi:hypothetical protein
MIFRFIVEPLMNGGGFAEGVKHMIARRISTFSQ